MEERICVFDDVYNKDSARVQADREKVAAFGMLARMKLWDRPKDADVSLVSSEKRYEPLWLAEATRRTLYTRKASYTLHVDNPQAQSVELLGQVLAVDEQRQVQLAAVEDCERTVALSEHFDGLQRPHVEKDLAGYATKFAYHDVADSREPCFVAPTLTAVSVLQQVKARLSTPVEADEIREDVLDVQSLILFYRPVHAFRYEWKGKQGVLEIDALNGHVNKEGDMFGNAVRRLGSREALFDFGVDFADLVLPGGGLMIKMVDRMSKSGRPHK